ncbi:trans-aconitate 2-methyltransferase [uncultured Cedecea sp.]|uniref:trans-aconitate 2-methyltransferase n=1 Tax=uncultured Cedecea sp. TaxID=988762 RepID=UPI002607DB6F|nr:trans-aconitate 2-methyltransferase [uncultured Cedecea sp.]
MQDWNPTSYLRFEAERTRPVKELAARIHFPEAANITDLGCGPGNSTAVLCKQHPKAHITGIDSSPAMLEKARTILPGCQFEENDISRWQAEKKQDVIFANASLQWVNDHETLFPRLAAQLSPRGVLAVQMPDNWQEYTHRLMRDVAEEQGHSPSHREAVLSAQAYYELLSHAGCEVDIWRTTYFHVLPSTHAIIDWLSTTGLRRFVNHLDPLQQEAYLERYHALLKQHYKEQSDSNILMPFPRLFIVARKTL